MEKAHALIPSADAIIAAPNVPEINIFLLVLKPGLIPETTTSTSSLRMYFDPKITESAGVPRTAKQFTPSTLLDT